MNSKVLKLHTKSGALRQSHVTPHKISPKKYISCKACIPDQTSINPEFLEAYAHFVCGVGERVTMVERCYANMLVPEYSRQVEIMNQLKAIASITDISNLEGVFMQLLMTDNTEQVDKLINLLVPYNILLDNIREVVSLVNQ